MKFSRAITLRIHFILDQCIPPLLRDSWWFMALPFFLLFGKRRALFRHFKKNAVTWTPAEYAKAYEEMAPAIIQRETDLNEACVKEIILNLFGKKILEVGCGRGHLLSKFGPQYEVSACDLIIDPKMKEKFPSIEFQTANTEFLPYGDASFDTVISTHTLEHVQNIHLSVSELRRVCRGRLIIVVPKQRPYRYTFDQHLTFFPYQESLLIFMHNDAYLGKCIELGGDLFYAEQRV